MSTASDPIAHFAGFSGILPVYGYGGYRVRADKSGVVLAFCWADVRRRFYDLAGAGPASIASEALQRIAELYRIRTTSVDDRPSSAVPCARMRARRSSPNSRAVAAREARSDQPED